MILSTITKIKVMTSSITKSRPWFFKSLATLSTIGGLVADVLLPLAPFVYYLLLASLFLLFVSLVCWLKFKLTLKDKVEPVLVASTVLSVVFGLFFASQTMWSENNSGALASLDGTGFISSLQERILSLEERVDVIEKSGGLIVSPDSASDYTHNARTYRSRSDLFNARRSYSSIFKTKKPTLELALEYISYLRDNLGTESAVTAFGEEVVWDFPSEEGQEISVGDGMLAIAGFELFVSDYDLRQNLYKQIIRDSSKEGLIYSWASYFLISDSFSHNQTIGYTDAFQMKDFMDIIYKNRIKFFSGVTDVDEPSIAMIAKIESWNDLLQGLTRKVELSDSSLHWAAHRWNAISFIVNDSVSDFSLKWNGKEFSGRAENMSNVDQAENIFRTKLNFGGGRDGFSRLADSGIENCELVYFDANGLGPFSSSYSINSEDAIVAHVKNELEGVTFIRHGENRHEKHHPGIHRLREEYASEAVIYRGNDWLTPVARDYSTKRRDRFKAGFVCDDGYWMCGKVSNDHIGYQCGDPWITMSHPDAGNLVHISFTPLLLKKYAIEEIRFSLGDKSLSRRVAFHKIPLSQIEWPVQGDRMNGLIPDDEYVLTYAYREKEPESAYLPVDISEGPLSIQIKYIDDTLSKVYSYDLRKQKDYSLINRENYPPWKIGPSKVYEVPIDGTSLNSTFAVIRETNGRREGLTQVFYENGQVANETLYVNGLRMAFVKWYENGSLRAVNSFRKYESSDSPVSYNPDISAAPFGPRVRFSENGEVDTEFSGYSKYDIRGLPYVSEDKLLEDARPHRDRLTLPIMRKLVDEEVTSLAATQSALDYWHEVVGDDGIIECGVIIDSKREGMWRTFSSEGNLLAEGSYFDNKKDRVWRTWRENGELASYRDESPEYPDRYTNYTTLYSGEGEISIAWDEKADRWQENRLGGKDVDRYSVEELTQYLEKWKSIQYLEKWYGSMSPSLIYSVE